ncbi:hypothetical protein [Hippea jasoniae]|uniref:hypothetical protein n=1 Tax=Hippea jasoniae TaxID=944479 RepID=UPI00054FFA3E|nr:hypothetical protein [Hippea jasoniae]
MNNKKLFYITLSSILIAFSLFAYFYLDKKTESLESAMIELNRNIREVSQNKLKLEKFLSVRKQIKVKNNYVRFQPVDIIGSFDTDQFVEKFNKIVNTTYENGFFFLDSFSLERGEDNSSFSVELKGKKVFLYGLK